MKARLILYRFQALLLVLCLLPITAAAGVVDSSALAYEKAIQMLTTSSLTDGEKLEFIRVQFEQAGSYQFGVDYLTLADALMILQAGNANRFDDALDIVQRLSRNEKFTKHYNSHLDKAGQPVLPDLGTLVQYIMARKLEAYKDLAGAVLLYDLYPVLDAAYRAGLLTSSIKLSQYEKAMDLVQEGSLGSIQQAAAIFEELGDFRDSPKRLQECRERMEALATLAPVITIAPTRSPEPIVQTPAQTAARTATSSSNGYAGPVAVTIMLNDDDTIATLSVGNADFAETEGIGSRTKEAEFTDRFIGKRVPLADGDVDVLAGATITSQAVIKAVNRAAEILSNTFEEESIKPTSTTKQPKVGDIITFGHYEQDDNRSNGKEPIAWRILSIKGKNALLISEQNLDTQPYNEQWLDTFATWETCTLRKWLNSNFVDSAFSRDERKSILTSSVMNDDSTEYGTDGGRDTKDMVFLLSIVEAAKHFGSYADRVAKNTAYAKAEGAYTGVNMAGWWWLRSPGDDQYMAAYISTVGTIVKSGDYISEYDGAVRPALWLDLSSL